MTLQQRLVFGKVLCRGLCSFLYICVPFLYIYVHFVQFTEVVED